MYVELWPGCAWTFRRNCLKLPLKISFANSLRGGIAGCGLSPYFVVGCDPMDNDQPLYKRPAFLRRSFNSTSNALTEVFSSNPSSLTDVMSAKKLEPSS